LQVVGARSLDEFVWKLKRPRKVMLMVKAGQAVDEFIEKLEKILSEGDIIIDGGNSEHQVCFIYCSFY
jgi:6-phosphogluconate dehydrogenase